MGGPNPVAAGYSGGSPPGTSPTAAGVQSPQLGLLPRQPLPKQLTAAIKACVTLERLAQLCQAHQAVLNPIHVAAIITKLPKLDVSQQQTPAAMLPGSEAGWMLQAQASAQQLQLRQLLQQLLSRLKVQGCSDHSPRGVANIVWALAKLQCAPDAELRVMLLDRFCNQLSSAVPQDISNVLWGVAKLTKEHAAVLSTGDAASPFDSAQGAEAALLQQEQVRLMLQHLCQQLPSASVQTISNSLWAVVVLQQEHQWCMCNCLTEIQTLLTVVCEQPQQAMPGHIQPIVRCVLRYQAATSGCAGLGWSQELVCKHRQALKETKCACWPLSPVASMSSCWPASPKKTAAPYKLCTACAPLQGVVPSGCGFHISQHDVVCAGQGRDPALPSAVA